MDVPKDHIPDVLVPKDNVKYQDNYKESFVVMRDEIVDFLDTILPR